jgi:hypothetical protein
MITAFTINYATMSFVCHDFLKCTTKALWLEVKFIFLNRGWTYLEPESACVLLSLLDLQFKDRGMVNQVTKDPHDYEDYGLLGCDGHRLVNRYLSTRPHGITT